MLFRQRVLDGIRDGSVTVAFRRWRRPTVRSGGTLLTAAGQLGIVSVSPVSLARISEADARHAGYASLDALRADLRRGSGGRLYRIDLGALEPDPRVALRESAAMSDEERRVVHDRLRRLDARSPGGPQTSRRAFRACEEFGVSRDHEPSCVREAPSWCSLET